MIKHHRLEWGGYTMTMCCLFLRKGMKLTDHWPKTTCKACWRSRWAPTRRSHARREA